MVDPTSNAQIYTAIQSIAGDVAILTAEQRHTREAVEQLNHQLVTLNGSVRSHGEALATAAEWRRQHAATHGDLEDDVRTTRERTYAIGMVNGILAMLAAAAAAVASAFRPIP